jgi:hypothetical protein
MLRPIALSGTVALCGAPDPLTARYLQKGPAVNEPFLVWLETGMIAFLAVLILLSAGAIWRQFAVRYREMSGHLADLRRLQEAQSMQLGCLPQIIETGVARHQDDSCVNELRRLVGDVFATAFQLCAVEQARCHSPDIDVRVTAHLKERAIGLISRIALFADQDRRRAEELVAMLRNWILDPQPERYLEWERAASQLALDVIRAQRPGAIAAAGIGSGPPQQPNLVVNFAAAAAA